MRAFALLATVALAGCATIYPPPGHDPQLDLPTETFCGSRWNGVTIQDAQKLENAVVRAYDACTADKLHWDANLICRNLKGWTFNVLAFSATKLDTATGRRYFLPPSANQLPPSEAKLKEAYGLTNCATYVTTLADADWKNGAAATEYGHVIDRCASDYSTWPTNGFQCAVDRVKAQFAAPH